MSSEVERAGKGNRWKLTALWSYSHLSLDIWAVITAFLVALLIRAGVIKHMLLAPSVNSRSQALR